MGRLAWIGLCLMAALASRAADVDVTGDWRVTITTAEGTISGKASLRQAGGKVTGWVGPDENDPIPVDGAVTENKVTLKTHPQEGRTVAFAQCDLSVAGNRMTGTIDRDKGKIEFVRSAQ